MSQRYEGIMPKTEPTSVNIESAETGFDWSRLKVALRFLSAVKPWWSAYSQRAKFVPISVQSDEGRPYGAITAIDKDMVVYIDTSFVRQASIEEIAGAVEREFRLHTHSVWNRLRDLDEEEWEKWANICFDMEVSSAIREEARLLMEPPEAVVGLGKIALRSFLASHGFKVEKDEEPEVPSSFQLRLSAMRGVFSQEDADEYGVIGPPIPPEGWEPTDYGMPSGKSAEEYLELIRSSADDDEDDESDDGSGEDDQEQEEAPDEATEDQDEDEAESDEDDADLNEDESEGTDDGSDESEADEDQEESAEEQSGSEDEDEDSDEEDDEAGAGGEADSDDDAEDDEDAVDGEGSDESDDEEAEDGSESDQNDGDEESDAESDSDAEKAAEGGSEDDSDESDEDSDDSEGDEEADSDSEGDQDGDSDDSDAEDGNQEQDGQEGDGESEEDGEPEDGEDDGDGDPSEGSIAQQIEADRDADELKDWIAQSLENEDDPLGHQYWKPERDDEEFEETTNQDRDDALDDFQDKFDTFSQTAEFSSSDADSEHVSAERKRNRQTDWATRFNQLVINKKSQVETGGLSDISYLRRNPNQAMIGPILPGMFERKCVTYGLLDVSFSMRKIFADAVNVFADISEQVFMDVGLEPTWFMGDEKIVSVGEFSNWEHIKANAFNKEMFKGGTDFIQIMQDICDGRVVFDGKHYPPPDMLVVLTDMQMQFPQQRFSTGMTEFIFASVLPYLDNEKRARYGLGSSPLRSVNKFLPNWIDLNSEFVFVGEPL